MYDYIKGTITDITPKYIVLENNNIGYSIKVPNPYYYDLNKEETIYTYLHVREDIYELYGFPTKDERDFFLSLISVKGLGPKGALAILASGKMSDTIDAIKASNNKFLEKFPGIGSKASQQIILDLNGKLNFEEMKAKAPEDPRIEDVRITLRNLGYKNQEIKKVEPVIASNIDKPMGEVIKITLKAMLNN